MLVPVLAGAAGAARAAGGGAGHGDPFAGILLELALLILAAMLGRWAAGRLGQPSVLGELLMSYGLWVFSNLGVILLLFMVGLESRVEEMLQVGYRALAVAVVGIAIPFVLGYGASRLFLPARRCSSS